MRRILREAAQSAQALIFKGYIQRVPIFALCRNIWNLGDCNQTVIMPKKRRLDEAIHSLSVTEPGLDSNDCVIQALCTKKLGNGQDYITDLAQHPSHSLIGVASASSEVFVLDAQNGLRDDSQHKLHGKAVTAVSFDSSQPSRLFSCSLDGCVKAWSTSAKCDEQDESLVTAKLESRLRDADKAELNCLDTVDNMVVAGSDGTVTFWDIRKPNEILAQFSDTHEKRVTQAHFHPDDRNRLLTASEDGFIASFSLANGLDEDVGFEGAVNVMDSVARVGFYGHSNEKLWCTTSTNNIYLWDWQAACSEDEAGGEGPFASCTDLRKQLHPHCGEEPTEQEYSSLLDLAEREGGNLEVAVAAQNGNFAISNLKTDGQKCLLDRQTTKFKQGHSAEARSILWPQAMCSCIITGGEDGRLAVWDLTAIPSQKSSKKKHKS